MSSPTAVTCPHCRVQFAVRDQSLIGRNVSCPKCSQPFVVAPQGQAPVIQAQPVQAQPVQQPVQAQLQPQIPSDPLAQPAADPLAPADPLADPFANPLADPLGAPAVPRPGLRKTARPRSGGKSGAWKVPALIGGGSVLGICLLGGLIMLLAGAVGGGGRGSDGNVVDMTWLPPDTEALMYVDLNEMFTASDFRTIMQHPQLSSEFQRIERQIGIKLTDLVSLTAGAGPGSSGQPFNPDSAVMVVRAKAALDPDKLAGLGLTKRDVSGTTMYVGPGDSFAVFQPDPQTAVLGSLTSVTAAAGRGATPTRHEEFDFVESGLHAFGAWVPSDTSIFRQAQPPPIPPVPGIGEPLQEIVDVVQGNLRGVCFAVRARGNNADMSVTANCDSSAAASRLNTSLGALIGEMKKKFKEARDAMPAEMVSAANDMINSIRARKSGSAVTLAVRLPQQQQTNQQMVNNLLPAIQAARDAARRAAGRAASSSGSGPSTASSGPRITPQQAAQRAQNRNKLKMIGLAMHNFHDTYRTLPPAPDASKDSNGRPLLSWRVHLLPYLEQRALYEQFHLDEPWDSPHNRTLIARMPDVYRCLGSNVPPGKTTMLAVDGPGTVFENGVGRHFRHITDGTSNTALVVTVNDNLAVEWTKPQDFSPPAGNAAQGLSTVAGGYLMLLCDGSVPVIPLTLTPQDVRNVLTRNDGQPVNW